MLEFQSKTEGMIEMADEFITNYCLSSCDSFTSQPVFDSCAGLNMDSTISPSQSLTSGTNDSVEGGTCSGCQQQIVDRYYLFALGQQWHNSCLTCVSCKKELESEGSCYVRDGFIYCKHDYNRRFGVQKCSGCVSEIKSGELVMRASEQIYHVHCFKCIRCNTLLQTGHHFGIFEEKIYCKSHYEQLQYSLLPALPTHLPLNTTHSTTPNSTHNVTSTTGELDVKTTTPTDTTQQNFSTHYAPVSHTNSYVPQTEQLNTTPTKPKAKRRNKNQQINNQINNPWSIGMGVIDPETGFAGQTQGQQVKQKRMRTSFKHHQLKIMKQYFQQVNHNPDAKDLKQLSQKTGLSKRVLQVWFQNARAKFRRGITDKDDDLLTGDGGDDNKEDNLMDGIEGDESNLSSPSSPPNNNNQTTSNDGAVLSFNMDESKPQLSNTDMLPTSSPSLDTPTSSHVLSPASTSVFPGFELQTNQSESLLPPTSEISESDRPNDIINQPNHNMHLMSTMVL